MKLIFVLKFDHLLNSLLNNNNRLLDFYLKISYDLFKLSLSLDTDVLCNKCKHYKNVSASNIVFNAYRFLRIALGSMKHGFFHKLLASLIVLVIPVSQFSPFINLLRH